MEYLSIYLLLTHYSPDFSLYNVVHRCPIPSAQNLFPQEPCKHAQREILSYLDASKPTLLLHSGRTYLASIISANGIDFHQSYHGAFFTQKFFSSLINVDNWAASPHARPVSQFEAGSIPALHVFDFLCAITSIAPGPSLLPATGLTHLQARHVGTLIFYSFAALNIKELFTEFKQQNLVLAGTSQQFSSPCSMGQVSTQGLIPMDAFVLVPIKRLQAIFLEAIRWQPA
jgi:hypothetical protein